LIDSKFAVVSLIALMVATEARADQSDNWLASYVAPKSLALKKIVLRKTEKGEIKARAYGTGYPDDVDWGEVPVLVCKDATEATGPVNFMASFSIPKAKELLIINPNSGGGKPNSGGTVMIELFTTFSDGRQPEYVRQWMSTSND